MAVLGEHRFRGSRAGFAAAGPACFPPESGWIRWGHCPPGPAPWLRQAEDIWPPGGAATGSLLGGGGARPHSNEARDRRAPSGAERGLCVPAGASAVQRAAPPRARSWSVNTHVAAVVVRPKAEAAPARNPLCCSDGCGCPLRAGHQLLRHLHRGSAGAM